MGKLVPLKSGGNGGKLVPLNKGFQTGGTVPKASQQAASVSAMERAVRTLLEKLRDAFRALLDKLTGAERRHAQTAEGKLTAALEAAAWQTGVRNSKRGQRRRR